MRAQQGGLRAEIVGREDDLTCLHEFLDRGSAGALLLVGDPGIGKTTLWEAGTDAARKRGMRFPSIGAPQRSRGRELRTSCESI